MASKTNEMSQIASKSEVWFKIFCDFTHTRARVRKNGISNIWYLKTYFYVVIAKKIFFTITKLHLAMKYHVSEYVENLEF